jgi:hypothetical protein
MGIWDGVVCLRSMYRALSSNPNAAKKKRKKGNRNEAQCERRDREIREIWFS